MSLLVIVTENIPPRLRGRLSIWLLEIRAGVYVGNIHKRGRLLLEDQIIEGRENGNVVMTWQEDNEIGFDFKNYGSNRRVAKMFDDLKLVGFKPEEDSKNHQKK